MFDITEFISQKKKIQREIILHNNFSKKSRWILLNSIHDPELKSSITLACEDIGLEVLENIDTSMLPGIDYVVSDEITKDFSVYTDHGIIPIIPEGISKSFQEFNPMKFQGNAFLFKKSSIFCIFEKICRALENTSYPWDRRYLIKNIISISNRPH